MFASAGESESLVRDVLLRDGATLRLLAPTPADFEDIKEFFDGLSGGVRTCAFMAMGVPTSPRVRPRRVAVLIGSR